MKLVVQLPEEMTAGEAERVVVAAIREINRHKDARRWQREEKRRYDAMTKEQK